MLGLFRARSLEAPHLAALRVHAAEDALDGAVLAPGVESLQHDEQALLALGEEARLQVRDALALRLELGFDIGLGVVLLRVVGVDVLELDFSAGRDAAAGVVGRVLAGPKYLLGRSRGFARARGGIGRGQRSGRLGGVVFLAHGWSRT